MPKHLPAGAPYMGRPHQRVLNTTLAPDVDQLLRELCPQGMTLGSFIGLLVFEYRARQEERAKVAQELAAREQPPVSATG